MSPVIIILFLLIELLGKQEANTESDKAEESNLGLRQLDLYLCSIIYLSSKILTGYSHFFSNNELCRATALQILFANPNF